MYSELNFLQNVFSDFSYLKNNGMVPVCKLIYGTILIICLKNSVVLHRHFYWCICIMFLIHASRICSLNPCWTHCTLVFVTLKPVFCPFLCKLL